MLNDVTAALAALRPEGTFAVELACGSEDLNIDAAGLGRLPFPLSAATAQRLRALARPAPFGRRDETLYDPKVRSTWEVEARLLKIDQKRWRPALTAQLAVIQKRLGLPPEGTLEATLDKMLVYEPGQFFAPHQDSERSDDMVGSLVITLPSTSTGGQVAVEHQKEKKVFRGAKRGPTDLSLLAFYADCRHEVKPITSGWRIVLTYHLRYVAGPRRPTPPRISAASAERLVASVEAYFATPVATRYGRSEPQRPDRLTYLLDHEYTSKSLAWGRLKNGDRVRALALRQAAERLDCECFLALADVHESWQCDDDWGDYGRRGRRSRHDEGEETDDATEEYVLVDLIDRDIELRHWVGEGGQNVPDGTLRPTSDEVCFTRASTDMTPFQSEHEGYMGNYGNTADRWYHRAAVVLWPREREFVIRAKASPDWAVSQLGVLVKAGAINEARERARSLLPFWGSAARRDEGKSFFSKLLKVLLALGDGALARALLAPFGPTYLSAGSAPAFVALLEAYGLAWAKEVFTAWSDRRYDASPWVTFLPHLCALLLQRPRGDGRALAEWLLGREVASFEQTYADTLRWQTAHERGEGAERLFGAFIALLEAAAVLGATSVHDGLLALVTAQKTALPVMSVGALLRKLHHGRTPADLKALGLSPLVRHVESSLEPLVAAPPRRPDDWSIEPPAGCTCERCRRLTAFLLDRQRIEEQWPLAEEGRQHVQSVIARHRLPVACTTVRRSRPYTLVLRKQPSLFERDAARREQQMALLQWLKKEWPVLTGEGNQRPTAKSAATLRSSKAQNVGRAPGPRPSGAAPTPRTAKRVARRPSK
jgi:2OG-Fe(II) oxygenase superfamily